MSRLRNVVPAAVLSLAVLGTGAAVLRPGPAGTTATAAPVPDRPGPARRSAAPAPRPPTEAELDLLHDARELLLRDCMRAEGFVYRPVPRRPLADARDFPLVVTDVAWARRHGYGGDLRRAAERLARDDPNQRYFRGLDPARRARALVAANGARPDGPTVRTPDGARLGRSADGCQSDADRRLYGDLARWFRARSTLTSLTALTDDRVAADPDYARALQPWSACMRDRGHAFAGPAAVRDTFPLPRGAELPLAVDEAVCARSSGLAGTVERLHRTHELRLHRQYRADVADAYRLQSAALPRARAVVAAG
ncbi:hypothetical protein [Streptomyces sp. NRRL S-87]|uniref:hypothetical protein n=1 Tax=Streptomyces sp. NRRL S-87 TaxID=1463920 RepID=UPI00068CC4B4|nr:hypothetical protein [Streptomyces sp. NRRL S-87]